MTTLLTLSLCLSLASAGPLEEAFQQARQEAGQKAKELKERIEESSVEVQVELVKLYASVVDENNRYYAHLEQVNFQLKEAGKKQRIEFFEIEENPISFGLVFDASGSMSQLYTTRVGQKSTNLRLAQQIMVNVLAERLKKDEYILALIRDVPDDQKLVVRNFTPNIAAIMNTVADQESNGSTPLYQTVKLTLERMKTANNERKAIIVVTDGEDNKTSKKDKDELRQQARESDVELFIVIVPGAERLFQVVCRDPRTGLLTRAGQVKGYDALAAVQDAQRECSRAGDAGSGQGGGPSIFGDPNVGLVDIGPAGLEEARGFVDYTGGRVFDAGSAAAIADAFHIIAYQTRYKYVLGYYPVDVKKDGKFHELDLEIKDAKSAFPKPRFPDGVPRGLRAYTNSHRYVPKD